MGKALTFMVFIWMIVNIAGAMYTGNQVSGVSTQLTADITDTEDASIPVTSTGGFPDSGYIDIEGERIGYPSKTDTAFEDTFLNDITRGTGDLEASAHSEGAPVRTITSAAINDSLDYQLATLTDSSGVLGYVSIPFKFLGLILTFFVLPLSFLGTDLEIITWIWGAVAIGILSAVGMAIIGGRRV